MLRRTLTKQTYGENEITLPEADEIPWIQQCLVRIEELNPRLKAEQDLQWLGSTRALCKLAMT